MGIKLLYNDNLRKVPNEYGDVSAMQAVDVFVVQAMEAPAFALSSSLSVLLVFFICSPIFSVTGNATLS